MRCLRRPQPFVLAFAAAVLAFVPSASHAISFGQVDNFQDGTTDNWSQGPNAATPPVNVPDGGPNGAGDAFVQVVSSGGFGPNAKMIFFNQAQWTGDYTTAGVNRISVQMANNGANTLNMRVAFQSAAGTLFGSTSSFDLPPDGVWYSANFDLTPAALTNIGGGETLDQALGHVLTLRILSALGGPSFTGDPIQGTLGVDNITATTANLPVPPPAITEFVFASGQPRISFTSATGQTYRVERKNSLTDANWIAVTNGDNLPGNGGIIQVNDSDPGVASLPHRFYRVVLL